MRPGFDPWQVETPPGSAKELAKLIGVPELVGALLFKRGLKTPSEASQFLNPTLSGLVDPYVFPDMEWGTKILAEAVLQNKKILIYGDYDADGITGTTCLFRFLKSIGARVGCLIPNRLTDGYGVHTHLLKKAISESYSVIVTVDCGTSDITSLKTAQELGLKVIVTDHHRVPEGLGVDWPLINPKRISNGDGLWELSGASMAFYLSVSLRRVLRKRGFFKNRREPDLKEYLDLISIGMVADRVKILGQSRILIANGINQLLRSKDPAINYLKALSGIEQRILNTEDIGFRIAPRINAPGRVGDPNIALNALISTDETQIKNLVDLMESLNQKRKSLEEELHKEVESQIQSKYQNLPPLILCHGENWHEGILGLVASKISNIYYRPALLLSTKEGILRGSGRSIPEIDLYDLMWRQRHLLMKYGGHSAAVGLTLRPSVVGLLEAVLSQSILERLDPRALVPKPYIDMELDLTALRFEEIEALSRLAPFGEGNPEPTFLCKGVKIAATKVIGGEHLKLILRKGNHIFGAIWFGKGSSKDLTGITADIIYSPRAEFYKGHPTIELKIVDLRPSLYGPNPNP